MKLQFVFATLQECSAEAVWLSVDALALRRRLVAGILKRAPDALRHLVAVLEVGHLDLHVAACDYALFALFRVHARRALVRENAAFVVADRGDDRAIRARRLHVRLQDGALEAAQLLRHLDLLVLVGGAGRGAAAALGHPPELAQLLHLRMLEVADLAGRLGAPLALGHLRVEPRLELRRDVLCPLRRDLLQHVRGGLDGRLGVDKRAHLRLVRVEEGGHQRLAQLSLVARREFRVRVEHVKRGLHACCKPRICRGCNPAAAGKCCHGDGADDD
mmetsp:Transcript_44256/g.96571  ORF Transcript_44256/g.96571 Transcript_44256/m.96571 type:complete len:274 (-) Transcript_44256:129-950(-)